MRTFVALACALAVAACGAPAGNSTQTPTPEQNAVESPEPTPTLNPTFDLATQQPTREPIGDDELTGVLGSDSIEGGCGYLQVPSGTRYQVIYPDGWDLELSPLQLTSPEGEVVARGGDQVTVRGSEASDMASICQIGPIFRASEVVSP